MRVRAPAQVMPELARIALACEAMTRARKLADWVGSGKNLTARSVLRPADAGRARQLLGIRLSGDLQQVISRTGDGRIALGGRGRPHAYGSQTGAESAPDPRPCVRCESA